MSNHAPSAVHGEDEDLNVVEFWLRKDPTRWVAGAFAGAFAGLMAMMLAGLLAKAGGMEFLFPIKLMGTILMGSSATEYGMNVGSILSGLIVVEAIAVFWGVIFSHFVFTNAMGSLLAMGLVWAAFSWIFIWNLFMPSFKPVYWAQISAGTAMPICLTYGLALSSVAFFDRMLRSNSR